MNRVYKKGNQASNYKHGGCIGGESRLYNIWCRMKQRCFDENSSDYLYYGGRDIYVCPEWIFDFAAFREWALIHGYADNLTIDRIDSNDDYKPDNCQWVLLADNAGKECRKPVNQFDLSGNLLVTYPSIIEAERQTGVGHQDISSICRGVPHRRTAGGYRWAYAS